MPSPVCPTCRRAVPPRSENPSFPFCTPRCRAVDLGKWFGEEYRVAGKQAELDEDGAPQAPGEGSNEETN